MWHHTYRVSRGNERSLTYLWGGRRGLWGCSTCPPPRLTSPHGGSVAPQERRRSSNFKCVLTRNQKVAYHNGGKNPHFPCDHLLDPKVNGGGGGRLRRVETGGWVGGGTDTPGYSLCTFFDIPHPQIWERFSHFETSFFTGEIEALISPHLSSMKSHK